jgi:hypothetical protein
VVHSELAKLENNLKDTLDGMGLYAQSKSIILQHTGPDDWIYGYLSFHEGTIHVAYRSTDDDYSDAMNNLPEEYQTHQMRHISICNDDWLEKLSQKEMINSILTNIDSNLQSMLESSDASVKTLESTLQTQSSQLAESCQKELVEIGDSGLLKDWISARNAVHLDPSDSVTRSSSYIESVCRKILDEQSTPLPKTITISSLIKECEKTLELTDDIEVESDIKQVIGGMKGVIQGIGCLRTHFGTAHGKSPNDFEIGSHYARLANDSAAAVR